MNMHDSNFRRESPVNLEAEQHRELPSNVEAEQMLLGAVLVNNAALDAIPPALEPRHFFEPLHMNIFDAMKDLQKAGRLISPVTVKALIPSDMIEMTDEVTGAREKKQPSHYLARLARDAVNVGWAPDFARTIMDCAARRACIMLGDKMDQAAYSLDIDIMDEVDALRMKFEDIVSALNGDEGSITAEQASAEYMTAITGGGGETAAGIAMPLPEMSRVLGDRMFRAQRLYGMLSSSGEGKTSLSCQIVYSALSDGHPVLVLSYDQTRTEWVAQMAAQTAGVEFERQMKNSSIRPLLSQKELDDCMEFSRRVFSYPFEVIDCSTEDTAIKLVNHAKRFVKKHKGGKTPLILIDHMGVIKPEDTRVDEGSKARAIGQRLKSMAKDLKAVVIVLQQRSGAGMRRPNPRPVAADLYGGEAARQPFDAIFYLYRAEHHMESQLDIAEDDREADKIRARFHQTYTKPFEVPIEGTAELGCLKLRFGNKRTKAHVNFEARFTKYVPRRGQVVQERMEL